MDRFDWNRDCGTAMSPAQALELCADAGLTFRRFAEQYRDEWPFEGKPPADLVEGMVRELHRAVLY